ncbi:SKP1 [Sergentomyia squamirostris]
MPVIKLKSSDGEVFDTELQIVKCSKLITTMLDALGMEEGGDEIVPLANVNSVILKKVLEWATHHKDDPQPPSVEDETKEKRTDDIIQWDKEFANVDKGTLIELILAANYLDIRGLMDVCCKTVVNMMKGKTHKEICKIFNINLNETPEIEGEEKPVEDK